MKILTDISILLSAIGAINWGLVAFLNVDLVKETARLLSMIPNLDKIIYGIVAIAGILALLSLFMRG